MSQTCSLAYQLPLGFPSNHQNPNPGLYTTATITITEGGGFVGTCGRPQGPIRDSNGTVNWTISASCADEPRLWLLSSRSCPCFMGLCPYGQSCEEEEGIPLSLGPAGTRLCDARPPEPPCKENCLGCISTGGDGGADDDRPGKGGSGCGVSVGGGGASVCPASGPGATLRYLGRGVGHVTFPGSDTWSSRTGLGRYWAWEWSESLVRDPDDFHVWMVTREAGYVEFTDADQDGSYELSAPSDDYRRLEKTAQGWELTDLKGTVQFFDSSGTWYQTTNRNQQSTTGVFDSQTGRLTSVSFPDGTSEEFVYGFVERNAAGNITEFREHMSGMLLFIREKGIDGTTKGQWRYEWDGWELFRVDRPDGTALEFFYNDPRLPGYLTRMEEVDDSGANRRVIGAWTYDDQGRVTDTWQGDTDAGTLGEDVPGMDARDHYHLDFETPSSGFTTVTGPEGAVIEYEVDTDPASNKPRVQSVTGAGCSLCGFAPESTFEYDDDDNPMRPTTVLDGEGHRTDFAYDDHGRVLTKTEAIDDPTLTRSTEFTYAPDFPAFVTQITQPSAAQPGMDRLTLMEYDPTTGDLATRTVQGFEDNLPIGPPTEFDCSSSAGSFDCDTTFQYNDAGKIESMDPPGFGTADQVAFQYPESPDPRGGFFPMSRTDPVGVVSYQYDAFNRRIRVQDYNGVPTDTCYDSMDRVTQVVQHTADPAPPPQAACPITPDPDDLETRYAYNAFGDLFQTILPEDNVIEYLYDEVGRLASIERKPDVSTVGEKTVFELDDAGNRLREQLFDASSTLVSETTYEYENGCQLTKTVRGSNGATTSTTEYDYDCNGNLTDVWDANHPRASFPTAPLRYQYDALNRLVQVNQTSGGSHPASTVCDGTSTTDLVTCYGYDVQDHLMQVEDAERNVTEYGYSDRDLLTDQDSQATGPSTFSYNEHGELVEETDARGVAVTRTVDAADRVTLVDYPDDTLDTTYAYGTDPMAFEVGRLVGITRDSETVAYAYDRFGRVLQDGDLSYTYDENGNRETITYPGGVTATYEFDGSDREVSLSVPGQTLVSGAAYLPSGPLASLTLGNGLTETRDFDERYFPAGIELGDATPLLEWSYTDIDAVGNVLSIEDLVSPDPADDRSFDYQDYQYFLTCAAGPWVEEGATCDPVSTDPVPFQWTYDRIGNRLSEKREAPPEELPGFVPSGTVEDTYDYVANTNGGNSPLLSEIDLQLGGSRLYTFGAAGHLEELESGASVVSLTIDAAGRIGRFQRSMAGGATLATADVAYDGRGFLREVTSLQTTIFQDGFETGDTSCWTSTASDAGQTPGGTCPPTPPDGPSVEALYDSQGTLHAITRTPSGGSPVTERVFYFAGRPLAQLTDDGTTQSWQLFTTDHLGTPIAGTDENGTLLWEGGLDPFGAPVETGTFLRLPGQWTDIAWQDAASGLNPFHNVNRWYEGGTGLYTRPDPLRYRQGVSIYTYGESNPVAWVDPLGLAPCKCTDECPSGEWTYAGGSSSGAGIIGRGDSVGLLSCNGNPQASLFVISNCSIVGLIGGIGAGGEFTTTFAPASCGCSTEDVLGSSNHVIASALAFTGTFGGCDTSAQDRPITFTLGVGKSIGFGVAFMHCKTTRLFPSE